MAKTLRRYGPLTAAWLVVFVGWPTPFVQADHLDVYDLDSLAYLSPDVVETQIVQSDKANHGGLTKVKITKVHKGKLKEGQVLAVYFGSFAISPEAADRLVLFGRNKDDFTIQDGGGLRLIRGEHVFSFHQPSNPGSYVPFEFPFASDKKQTVVEFRKLLENTLAKTAQWAGLLEAKQDQLDTAALMKLLAERSKLWANRSWDNGTGSTDGSNRDHIAELICARLANSHDPDLLSRALPLAGGYHEHSILDQGFGTPRGRDYLLAKVTDAKEPMEKRLRYTRAMRNAGEIYTSMYNEIGSGGCRPVVGTNEGTSAYHTRIARAAFDNRDQVELCDGLVDCLYYYGCSDSGALAVLKEIYDKKPAESTQFAIETTAARAERSDPTAYAKLNSPCGKFISILTRPNYVKSKERRLNFNYAYVSMLPDKGAKLCPSVVLVHQGTQQRIVFSSECRFPPTTSGTGGDSIVLPQDLPAGTYHVFYQLSEGEKVISTGHFLTAEL